MDHNDFLIWIELLKIYLYQKVAVIRTLNQYANKNSHLVRHIFMMFLLALFLPLSSRTLPLLALIQKVGIIIHFLDKCYGSQCLSYLDRIIKNTSVSKSSSDQNIEPVCKQKFTFGSAYFYNVSIGAISTIIKSNIAIISVDSKSRYYCSLFRKTLWITMTFLFGSNY